MDLMNRVCKPYLDKFVIVFIDDIFIYLRRNEEYEEHLRQLSELFKNKELYTEFSKCEFWLPKVQFLCYVVDNQGIHERDLRKYSYRIYHKATKNNKQLQHDLGNRDHPKSYADVRRKPLELHAEGNYIPPKPDLMFIDEQVKSKFVDIVSNVASSDVKTVVSKYESVDIKNKGVYSTVKTKTVRKNTFSPLIIKDWNSNDESEVEFEPKVEVKTVRPCIEKIKFFKTAREKLKKVETPKQHKHGEDGLKLKKLMELSTKLSNRVLDLENIKSAQAKEIANLKKKVKKLERKRRSRTPGMNLFKICTSRRRSLGEEDASK
uniref:Putative reverse transcriptase domain-containing protein n=1 Tax=Tanacetum cinerariifolium TaxID=118510 RepID=A0A699I831_TANCI|nr:putative reverse transcriptase domain-containing protein [Tanacetum cinerariifolium]